MWCAYCGNKFIEDVKFCPNCGKKVIDLEIEEEKEQQKNDYFKKLKYQENDDIENQVWNESQKRTNKLEKSNTNGNEISGKDILKDASKYFKYKSEKVLDDLQETVQKKSSKMVQDKVIKKEDVNNYMIISGIFIITTILYLTKFLSIDFFDERTLRLGIFKSMKVLSNIDDYFFGDYEIYLKVVRGILLLCVGSIGISIYGLYNQYILKNLNKNLAITKLAFFLSLAFLICIYFLNYSARKTLEDELWGMVSDFTLIKLNIKFYLIIILQFINAFFISNKLKKN